MAKTAFLFPGQGSQAVGMGQDLFRKDDYFLSLVDKASQFVGEDLKRICLRGPEKKLAKAAFVQPLIVAVSLGYLRHVHLKKIPCDYVLGHSLGEITALVAAGVIDQTTAIAVAAKRGQLMDEAASACNGGMIAVASIDSEKIQTIINEKGFQDTIVIANFNAQSQTVISGSQSSFDKFSEQINKAGGRCKKLNVVGPWHSPYMKKAYTQFTDWVKGFEFSAPSVSLVLNGSGEVETDKCKIKKLISASLINPVRFTECMAFCENQNVDTFLEIGPGRVLAGLVRANGFMGTTRIFNCNNLRGVELASANFLPKES